MSPPGPTLAQRRAARRRSRVRRTLPPGTRVGDDYEVIEHMSRGNVLDVYDAWSDSRDCRVVLKTLRPDQAVAGRRSHRLISEGRLLCRLAHPHVVRGYQVISEPRPVVVMETLSGETLAHLIQRSTPRLAIAQIALLGVQLCSALSYLHHSGILHLDLKPANIVAEAGRAKVIDLSLARRPGRMESGLGTWCYMAPEQARGGRIGAAADVWGVGVVLWEAAAGQRAFGDDRGDARHDYPQLERAAVPLRALRRAPAAFTATIDACLEPDPADRPALPELTARLEAASGLAPGARRRPSG